MYSEPCEKMMMRVPISIVLEFRQLYAKLAYSHLLKTGKKLTIQDCQVEMLNDWIKEKQKLLGKELKKLETDKYDQITDKTKDHVRKKLQIKRAVGRELDSCRKLFGTRKPSMIQKKQAAVVRVSRKADRGEISLEEMRRQIALINEGKTYEAYV